MKQQELTQRLAVCSWSLQPVDIHDLIQKLHVTGISQVQLALDPLLHSPQKWQRLAELFAEKDLRILSAMFGCEGEDYSSLESIRRTGGIAPDATWERNRSHIQAAANLARSFQIDLVTFHAGFLPHEESDPDFSKMLLRLAEVADIFARAKITLALETGQETAPVLAQLLRKLNRPNVGVNFDPANMILYGKGDPIEALEVLGSWIRQVHIKDAKATQVPGTWGEEVPAGQGQVQWPNFFTTLRKLAFTGPIVIEREAGNARIEDIRQARRMVETTFV